MADDNIDPDDFSDSELGADYEEAADTVADQEQDEQHTQKVNGKIDSLKLRVKELESQLKSEKRQHEKSKEELSVLRESPKTMSVTNNSASLNVISELISICAKFHVSTARLTNDHSEEAIVGVLKALGRSTGPTGVEDSSRPDTSMSMKSSKSAHGTQEWMVSRIKSLEDELRLALGAAEDIKALKTKLVQMIDRIRSEKEARERQMFDLKTTRKKLLILTDHIEKLMSHLKHEAAAKIRALETLREQEKTTFLANQKCLKFSRQGVAKDRLIMELREGGKILEDQLRLMDEKYLELRTKLDFARENSEKRIRKAEKIAGELRVKFALAGNMQPLDSMPMPQSRGDNGSYTASEFDEGYSVVQSVMTADSKSSTGRLKRNKSAPKEKVFETEKEKEEEVQRLLEKMRLKQGRGANWTEEKARQLTESR